MQTTLDGMLHVNIYPSSRMLCTPFFRNLHHSYIHIGYECGLKPRSNFRYIATDQLGLSVCLTLICSYLDRLLEMRIHRRIECLNHQFPVEWKMLLDTYANYNMLNLHQSMSIVMVQAGITNFKVCMKIR